MDRALQDQLEKFLRESRRPIPGWEADVLRSLIAGDYEPLNALKARSRRAIEQTITELVASEMSHLPTINDRWMQAHVPFAAERSEREGDVGRLARDVLRLANEVARLQGRTLMSVIRPNREADRNAEPAEV